MTRAHLALTIATGVAMGLAWEVSRAAPGMPLQGPAESHLVELATVAWLRGQHAGPRVGLDEVRVEFGRVPSRQQDARPLPELLALADSLRGPIVAADSPRVCRADQYGACIAVVVRIGTPVLAGDTARVWTFALNARDGEVCDRHLELGRVPGTGTWRVTRVLEIRRTL